MPGDGEGRTEDWIYVSSVPKTKTYYISPEAKVPVIFKGKVIKVSDDFLGESVFVSHDTCDSNGRQLYTIYGHVKPGKNIHPGERLSEGDIMGVIADTRNSGAGVVPHHLHVSVAWIPDTMQFQEIGWQTVSDPTRVTLLDPLDVIECPYTIVQDVRLF